MNTREYSGDILKESIKIFVGELFEEINERKIVDIEYTKRNIEKMLNLINIYNNDIQEWFETEEYKEQRKRVNEILKNQGEIIDIFKSNDYFAQQFDNLEKLDKIRITTNKF